MAPPGYSEARRRAAAAAERALARNRGEAGAARAAVQAADTFFEDVRKAIDLEAQLAARACVAGCAWCCYQLVAVTRAELEMVMEAVAARPARVRAAIAARARDAAARGAGLDPRRWWAAHIPCPLLGEDGLCTVHPARPLACRAHNSADAAACHRSFQGEAVRTPVLAAQHGVWAHAQLGLMDALAGAGRDAGLANLALAVDDRLSRGP